MCNLQILVHVGISMYHLVLSTLYHRVNRGQWYTEMLLISLTYNYLPGCFCGEQMTGGNEMYQICWVHFILSRQNDV